MKTIKNITVPEPCRQSWQEMMPVSGGRHCQSCSKTVTDFTKMSNKEIIAYLSSHTNVCGRISDTQIAGINQSFWKPVKRIPAFLNYKVAALFACIMAFKKVAAHNNIRQSAKTEQHLKHDMQDTVVKDTSGFTKISGTIYAADDGTPIPGASVIVTGANNGVATNSQGRFEIRIPLNNRSLEIKAIGYKPKNLKLKKLSKTKYKVYLEESDNTIGEVIIVE